MLIEQNTNYAYKLKYIEHPTFDKIRDLSVRFYRELPKELQEELFEALHRGVDILTLTQKFLKNHNMLLQRNI